MKEPPYYIRITSADIIFFCCFTFDYLRVLFISDMPFLPDEIEKYQSSWNQTIKKRYKMQTLTLEVHST